MRSDIDAAIQAPSAVNQQPWAFVVVQDADLLTAAQKRIADLEATLAASVTAQRQRIEELEAALAARADDRGITFVAFTATPKYKTLEVFGHRGPGGKPNPFHLYSMRQAIEEGFIMDVLKNYTTYKSYFQLIRACKDDPGQT